MSTRKETHLHCNRGYTATLEDERRYHVGTLVALLCRQFQVTFADGVRKMRCRSFHMFQFTRSFYFLPFASPYSRDAVFQTRNERSDELHTIRATGT